MKIIVPVDFTEVSFNAAAFAVKMLSDTPNATLILYHVYEDESGAKLVLKSLHWLKDSFLLNSKICIKIKAEKETKLISSLARLARLEDADLIVMAVNEREKIITGNFSLQMIEQNVCPVLVVPPDCEYTAVKNVSIAFDVRDALHTLPLIRLKKLLAIFKPNLHFINVTNKDYVTVNDNYLTQKKMLEDLFAEYQPRFYFINAAAFHETLRQFVTDKQIDLMLTVTSKNGFINQLVKGKNTRKMVFETAVPVLAAQE